MSFHLHIFLEPHVYRDTPVTFTSTCRLPFHPSRHVGHEAAILEKALGMKVIRHASKKPAGTPEELQNHFGCPPQNLIMIGDRYMTDILYGNRLGLLTIYTKPLTAFGEPFAVKFARKIENSLVHGAGKQTGERAWRGCTDDSIASSSVQLDFHLSLFLP